MHVLSTKLDNLYTKLVKEYNRDNWAQIASLDRFLIIKRDAASKANNIGLFRDICDVIEYADNDY